MVTLFWAISEVVCIRQPIPAPRTTMYVLVSQVGVSTVMVENSHRPIASRAVPMIGNVR